MVVGFTIEKDIFNVQQWIPSLYSAEVIELRDLKKYYIHKVPGPGLYANEGFLSKARLRAKQRIADHRQFYDGTQKFQIKPHPYLDRTTNEEIDRIFE
jgi:hypothetical protein